MNDRDHEKVPETSVSKFLNEIAARFQFSDFVYVCCALVANEFIMSYLLKSFSGDPNWRGLKDVILIAIVFSAIVIIRRRKWEPDNTTDPEANTTADSEPLDSSPTQEK